MKFTKIEKLNLIGWTALFLLIPIVIYDHFVSAIIVSLWYITIPLLIIMIFVTFYSKYLMDRERKRIEKTFQW